MLVFDIDGVVANLDPFFLHDVCEHFGCALDEIDTSSHCIKIPSMEVPNEEIYKVVCNTVLKHGIDIPPCDGAVSFINEYYKKIGRPIVFITARNRSKEMLDCTKDWLNAYLSDIPYIVHHNEDKGTVIKNSNGVYTSIVEDRLKTANDLNFLQRVFLINRPWNMFRDTQPHVQRITSFEEIWDFI